MDTASSLNSIGLVYHAKGDHVQALEYYQRALKIKLAVYGKEHPGTATTLNNIGSVYYAKGDHVQALEYY